MDKSKKKHDTCGHLLAKKPQVRSKSLVYLETAFLYIIPTCVYNIVPTTYYLLSVLYNFLAFVTLAVISNNSMNCNK